jgi:UDPglucose 6-dehydrogenase
LKVAQSIVQEGGVVFAFDPMAKPWPDSGISVAESALDACAGADALVVLTEWKHFGLVEASAVKSVMNENPLVFDTRGILPFERWNSNFEKFHVIGKEK